MNESDKNPDEFWRSVFDEAAETPPRRVWDAIERRLDEPDEAGVVPLWGAAFFAKRSVSWGLGVAATVALLLVGWWLNQSSETQQLGASNQTKATTTDSYQQDAVALNQSSHRGSSSPRSISNNGQQQRNGSCYADASSPAITTLPGHLPGATDLIQPSEQPVRQIPAASSSLIAKKTSRNKLSGSRSDIQLAMDVPPVSPALSIILSSSAANPLSAQSLVELPAEASDRIVSLVQAISPHPMQLRSAGQIHRIVWIRPHEAPQEPALAESKRASHEHWVSLNVMPSAFNPAVSVQATQPALASAYGFGIANSSQPPVKSRAELSVAYQANAGLQLNDHWSVESGIGYLAGHATVDSPSGPSPASMLSALNMSGISVNTLYTEVLRQSVQRNTAAIANRAASNSWDASSAYNSLYAYDPQTRQTLTNDYQFVQVPIQVGYQLRPRKRLGLALLGGFLTNIFLRNTVDNQLVIKPEDGVYQPVTLAAAMGARFQYRSSQHWSASLAGMYQPTLGSATKSGSSVQSNPTTTGMSFGVDYHF